MPNLIVCDADSIENDTFNNSSIVAFVLVTAVTFFSQPLPSNEKGIQTHTLRGGIYNLRRWGGLGCHDIHTEFLKDWF